MKKQVKQIIIFIILSIILQSCFTIQDNDKDNKYINVTINDFTKKEIKGEIYELDSLLNPVMLYCNDSVLHIVERSNKNFVSSFNIINGKFLANNVPAGVGPNESIVCWSLQKLGNYIYSLDMQLKKIYKYDYTDFISKSNISPIETINFEANPLRAVVNSNNQFIVYNTIDTETLLSKYDSLGNRINFKLSYPELIKDNISNYEKKMFYQSRLYYNFQNKKIILTYDYCDLIDIYDNELNLQKRIHGPLNFSPKLIISENEYHLADDTRWAFEYCCTTSNEIFVLFNGKTDEEDSETDVYYNQIFSFDYDGNPLNYYLLDIPIFSFCIDEKTNTIYGLTDYPERCIVKFQL